MLAFDAATGKELWNRGLHRRRQSRGADAQEEQHASPTPVSDGEKVWVHFGHMGPACLDLDGNVVWKTERYTYTPMHGNGGSPILVDDKLVFSIDGLDQQYVVAVEQDQRRRGLEDRPQDEGRHEVHLQHAATDRRRRAAA